MLKTYVRLWILITCLLGFESYALNVQPELSILAALRGVFPGLSSLSLVPLAGKPISLILGWTGTVLMLLTNPYILRKRFHFMSRLGSLPGWLNFHIFCGLLGPTCILFHSNFKIGGLVAISFWSMVIVFASGVVGRYFYVQIAKQKSELDTMSESIGKSIKAQIDLMRLNIDEPGLEKMKVQSLKMAGFSGHEISFVSALFHSMIGDLFLGFRLRRMLDPYGATAKQMLQGPLSDYAITGRRAGTLEEFRILMGYWHSFHLPFAVFMYVVGAIHITVALLFQVRA